LADHSVYFGQQGFGAPVLADPQQAFAGRIDLVDKW
jgi:hypothetical protein